MFCEIKELLTVRERTNIQQQVKRWVMGYSTKLNSMQMLRTVEWTETEWFVYKAVMRDEERSDRVTFQNLPEGTTGTT